MPHLARKRMKVLGGVYAAGDPIPFDDIPLKTKKYLIEQRRVIYEAEKPGEIPLKHAPLPLASKGDAPVLEPRPDSRPKLKRKRKEK